MKTPLLVTARAVLFSVALVMIGGSAWATYAVRISDLRHAPAPPNPIRVTGSISSVDPLRISDGSREIALSGVTAEIGDFLSLEGNWDGTTLSVSQSACKVIMYSPYDMLYVPAGTFSMGNNGSESYSYPDELPRHSVYLSGYYIGKHEVTRGEYRRFMDAGGYSDSAYWSSAGWSWKLSTGRTQPSYWTDYQDWSAPYDDGNGFTQTDNHPVVGVCYYEAEAFCNWAGGHLPTEAQWEKAARWSGSHANVYPWSDTWDQQKCNNYYDSGLAGGGYEKSQTALVGSYLPGASPYGCQDMAGNVSEWCQDWYLSNYYSLTPASDPQGPASGGYRVLRGSSWDYHGNGNRCAVRGNNFPNLSTNYYGFRLAR